MPLNRQHYSKEAVSILLQAVSQFLREVDPHSVQGFESSRRARDSVPASLLPLRDYVRSYAATRDRPLGDLEIEELFSSLVWYWRHIGKVEARRRPTSPGHSTHNKVPLDVPRRLSD